MEGSDASPAFGHVLRDYRLRAGFSQERLAERAGISAKAIGAVEQGARQTPHRQTVALLADALELSPAERAAMFAFADDARARVRRDRGAVVANTMPAPLTPFIARPDVEEIAALLDDHRLVTITGTGGVGKTRTAIEVCSRRLRDTSIPIVFIDLTSAFDANLVLSKIATALNVRLAESDPIASLTAGIGSQKLLLVLDNCEHVVADAANVIARVLPLCPSLSILATSREVLNLSGEIAYRLPSLEEPAAIALFRQRAVFADATLELGSDDMPAIAGICRRLDRIPLAIELAASQLPKMGLTALRTHLLSIFDAAGPRDVPARQQTMRAAIAWSFDLLGDRERSVMMRLSVFSGGFTIEAAESVASSLDIVSGTIRGIVNGLIAKSLVNVEQLTGTARYSLVEAIRTFGREMLDANGYAAVTACRHAEWIAGLGETLDGKSQSDLRDAQVELDNARAAIAWCHADGSQGVLRLAARIITGMRRLWRMSGRTAELARLIEETLTRLDTADANTRALSDLHYSRISIAFTVDTAAVAEALPFFERAANFEDAAMAYVQLALSEARAGALQAAATSYARAGAYFKADERRRAGRNYIHYRCIGVWLHAVGGNIAAAHADIVGLQSETDQSAHADQLVGIYQLRAEIESASGNFAAAIDLCRMLVERWEAELTFYQVGTVMSNLSCYHLLSGNLSEAERCGHRALERLADWQNDRLHWDAVIAMQHLAATLRARRAGAGCSSAAGIHRRVSRERSVATPGDGQA